MVSGCYALYYYDAFQLLPPRPPVLTVAAEPGVAGRVRRVLEPVARGMGIRFALLVRSVRVAGFGEAPPALQSLPVAPPADALADSLELVWRRVEPAALTAMAFYTYSPRIEDYVELARLAQGYGFRGALKLVALAAGMAWFMGSARWYLVYTRLLRYERPPKPSSLDPELLEDLEYALTQTIYSNGVYNAIASRFTSYIRYGEGEEDARRGEALQAA